MALSCGGLSSKNRLDGPRKEHEKAIRTHERCCFSFELVCGGKEDKD